jgi:hypothetical protein
MRRVERQNSFFRRYMEGGKTVRQVMAEMRMKPTTLQRWCEEPAFKKRFDAANEALRLMAAGDAIVLGKVVITDDTPAADSNSEQPVAIFQSPPGGRPARARAAKVEEPAPARSERERLVELNGPEAGEAYDELVALRAAEESAAEPTGGDADAASSVASDAAETSRREKLVTSGA